MSTHDDDIPPRLLVCFECHRDYLGHVGPRNRCQGCKALGSGPGECLRSDCGADLRWSEDERVAECPECLARYKLETLRTLALGELVKRVIAETKTGSAAEVGAFLLREGRASLRRVV